MKVKKQKKNKLFSELKSNTFHHLTSNKLTFFIFYLIKEIDI